MNRFHIQSMAKNKCNFLSGAQICQSVPAKHTLCPDNQIVSKRPHNLDKGFGLSGQVFMQNDFTLLMNNAQILRLSLQIDTADRLRRQLSAALGV